MSANFRRTTHLFTSESVTMGHPDKVSDQISDAVLDAILAEELKLQAKGASNVANARVACETLVTTGQVVIAGEVRTNTYVDAAAIARQTIKEIGYTHPDIGFDYHSCGVLTAIHSQSADIAQGVDHAEGKQEEQEMGAGDQGLMFGYATNETDVLMPLPIHLAHRIVERLAELRQDGTLKWLRPDGKSQVTVEYKDEKPVRVHTVVVSTQHDESVLKNDRFSEEAKKLIIDKVIKPVIPDHYWNSDIVFHINPTGKFIIGGPHGDTGLTGRKIIVDSYGGRGAHGGGAFSGKDPTKVDRSACYMARYIAKNIVAAGIAESAEVQLAYAIGVAQPVSVTVSTEGTSLIPEDKIAELVQKHFPLTPRGIIKHLDLFKPIYKTTARHGHFGRVAGGDGSFSWEKTDKAEALAKDAGVKARK
ncbi:MAG TPA: methionine adenosyltransferase [Tepidisphaeraceae bacterium]|nr:methionine adenosyltransferase [Tepidisphaeraceae bacterium]